MARWSCIPGGRNNICKSLEICIYGMQLSQGWLECKSGSVQGQPEIFRLPYSAALPIYPYGV